MRNVQELREDDNIVDTDTDLEHGSAHGTEEVEKIMNKKVTTGIAENRQDKNLMTRIYFNAAVEAQT